MNNSYTIKDYKSSYLCKNILDFSSNKTQQSRLGRDIISTSPNLLYCDLNQSYNYQNNVNLTTSLGNVNNNESTIKFAFSSKCTEVHNLKLNKNKKDNYAFYFSLKDKIQNNSNNTLDLRYQGRDACSTLENYNYYENTLNSNNNDILSKCFSPSMNSQIPEISKEQKKLNKFFTGNSSINYRNKENSGIINSRINSENKFERISGNTNHEGYKENLTTDNINSFEIKKNYKKISSKKNFQNDKNKNTINNIGENNNFNCRYNYIKTQGNFDELVNNNDEKKEKGKNKKIILLKGKENYNYNINKTDNFTNVDLLDLNINKGNFISNNNNSKLFTNNITEHNIDFSCLSQNKKYDENNFENENKYDSLLIHDRIDSPDLQVFNEPIISPIHTPKKNIDPEPEELNFNDIKNIKFIHNNSNLIFEENKNENFSKILNLER